MEFFGDEKKLLDFEGARVRNHQAGAITVLTLSCADILLSLEIFKLTLEDSESRPLTVSSMIAKVQEINVQTLLQALQSEEEGDQVAKKWMKMVKQEGLRYRRRRKQLHELGELVSSECMAA